MLDYGRLAADPHWAEVAVRACDFVWQTNRAPDGHFPERWDGRPDGPLELNKLMWDASNARLFFRTAAAVGLPMDDDRKPPRG